MPIYNKRLTTKHNKDLLNNIHIVSSKIVSISEEDLDN